MQQADKMILSFANLVLLTFHLQDVLKMNCYNHPKLSCILFLSSDILN